MESEGPFFSMREGRAESAKKNAVWEMKDVGSDGVRQDQGGKRTNPVGKDGVRLFGSISDAKPLFMWEREPTILSRSRKRD